MRTALALPVGLALAFAPGRASADTPHVAVRLEYVRSSGGEACPAEPTTLRAEVAARMGYDPFEATSARERLAVVMAARGRGFVAHVERFNAAGESTWSETFPPRPLQGDCEALMSPLASYLRASFLSYQGRPTAPPAAPPLEPTAPLPKPPPSPSAAPARELRAPLVQSADPPEPANVPNRSRITARGVAIVATAVSGAFLGLGIGWTVYGQNKANAARALATQFDRAGGPSECQSAGAPGSYCSNLLGAWQTSDAALSLRNGWFAAAGVSAAIGVAATVWTLSLPTTIKGQPQTQVSLRPGGLVFSGSF
jgi:hypothetical protein